jgi:hypothetical protein
MGGLIYPFGKMRLLFHLMTLPAWFQPLLLLTFRKENQMTSAQVPVLYDQLSDPILAEAIGQMLFSQRAVASRTYVQPKNISSSYFANVANGLYDMEFETEQFISPFVQLFYPVTNPKKTRIIGAVSMALNWNIILYQPVPSNTDFLDIIIENTCGQVLTYSVNSEELSLQFRGEGDLHERQYDHMEYATTYEEYDYAANIISSGSGVSVDFNETGESGSCRYRFRVYPTAALERRIRSSRESFVYATGVILIFLFTSVVFVMYDAQVRRRQAKVMASAKRTNDIVVSLYPSNVRSRLFRNMYDQPTGAERRGSNQSTGSRPGQDRRRSSNGTGRTSDGSSGRHSWTGRQEYVYGTAPIADLFPSATVFFLDIAGFTAWSSEREPTQVC